jgi:starvation-inducible DNA-binding protein
MNTTVVEPGIAITRATHDATLGVLTQVLSDEHVLYMKLRNYHWNVEGAHHRELHALFAEQYRIIEMRIDEVAERMRTLGAPAIGTMTEYLQRSLLREHPGRSLAAKEMLHDLLECHCEVVRFLRQVFASPTDVDLDVGTADLLTRLIQDHEKMAWVLRATMSDDRTGWQSRQEERSTVLYE